MPHTIDDEKFRKQTTFDVSNPHNTSTGIPTKEIPVLEYPRVVYKHPNEPFRTVEHRNSRHEVVDVETLATEHLSLLVNSKEELDKALAEGWVKEAYIPQTPPKSEDQLYMRRAAKK